MEREKRKRMREIAGDDEEKNIQAESRKGKVKLPAAESAMMNSMDDNFQNINNDEILGYEFRDTSIGSSVFDFPWIKEGLIFKADDYLSPEDYNFATYPNYNQHDETNSAETLCAIPDGKLKDDNKLDDDDESLWSSLQVDDLESIDRIWSCVIDQPLQINFGMNKG